MQLKLKDNPREWRKTTLLSALALAVVTTVLHLRHVVPTKPWLTVLALLAVISISALLQPKWFRGYYLVSARIGFFLSQCVGHVMLTLLFLLVLTPLGIVLRLSGKDFLRLKRPRDAATHWQTTRANSQLDRPF